MSPLSLQLGEEHVDVDVDTAIIAGWAGRDQAAVEEHIVELEALGVPRPSTVPVFYRVSASRLTTAPTIESTAASSGEVEAVLLQHGGRTWVGVGSDHTDREVESYGVAVSKQLCDKPIGDSFWALDEVLEHWDRLVIRAWIDEDLLYQEGGLDTLLPVAELSARAVPSLAEGTLMFCGTVPAIGGIRPARTFTYELEDPVLDRRIRASYRILDLPLVS